MKHLIWSLLIIFTIVACSKEEPIEETEQFQTELRNGEVLPVWMLGSTTLHDYQPTAGNPFRSIQTGFNLDSIVNVELKRNDRLKTKSYGPTPKKAGSSHDLIVHFKDGSIYQDEVWYKDTINEFSYKPIHDNKFEKVNNYIVYERNKNTMSYYDNQFEKWKTKYEYIVTSKNLRYKDYIPSNNSNQTIYLLNHIW